MPYREFVDRISGGQWPTDVILNRSREHAAVIIEFLFIRSQRSVRFVTERFCETVFGTPAVIAAARTYLARNPDATIHILSEHEFNRGAHPFFVALDGAYRDRISLQFLPAALVATYSCNFAVADGQSYRFEESRLVPEAFVRFGDAEFGADLEARFEILSRAAISAAGAILA